MSVDVAIAGGVPMVVSAGPLLEPETTQIMPYLLTTSDISSPIRLFRKGNEYYIIRENIKAYPECAQWACSP